MTACPDVAASFPDGFKSLQATLQPTVVPGHVWKIAVMLLVHPGQCKMQVWHKSTRCWRILNAAAASHKPSLSWVSTLSTHAASQELQRSSKSMRLARRQESETGSPAIGTNSFLASPLLQQLKAKSAARGALVGTEIC
jgi:hypothetical protein